MVAIARVASSIGRLIFDTKFQKVMTNSIKASGRLAKMQGKSRFAKFGKQIGDAFVRAEKKTGKTPFFQDMKKLITTYPADLKTAWNSAPGLGGKAKAIWNATKSRGPLLGYGLPAGFEVPNSLKATTEDGVATGAVEAGKSTARLAGGALGASIAGAFIPFIGPILGWIGGDYLAGKVVGKSYTEKQLAQAEKTKELIEQSKQEELAQMQQMFSGYPSSNSNVDFSTMPYYYGMNGLNGLDNNFPMPTLTNEQLMQLGNALYGTNKLDLQV